MLDSLPPWSYGPGQSLLEFVLTVREDAFNLKQIRTTLRPSNIVTGALACSGPLSWYHKAELGVIIENQKSKLSLLGFQLTLCLGVSVSERVITLYAIFNYQ